MPLKSDSPGQLRGSCVCGTVTFRVQGVFEGFYLCHCSRCRKVSGSAHSANMAARGGSIEWLTGEADVSTFRLPGTRFQRSFCQKCGSALPGQHLGGALLVVPAGSLDDEAPLRPTAHIWVASRADWDVDLETVPRLDGLPG